MERTLCFSFRLCVLYFCVYSAASGVGNQTHLKNTNVYRHVDISTQLVKIIHIITMQNNRTTDANSFFFVVEPYLHNNLSYIEAQSLDESVDKMNLNIVEMKVDGCEDTKCFQIDFLKPLRAGRVISVQVEAIYTHYLSPWPYYVKQSESQLVLYEGNLYFYSPYVTENQHLDLKVSSNKIEYFSDISPTALKGNYIKYGPYKNIRPFADKIMKVHYENNKSFLSVTNLERTIVISHWGVISVKEVVDLKHRGAVLKGPYSGHVKCKADHNCVERFLTILPASATNIRYYDEIGNISTSHVRTTSDAVFVVLKTRYPMYGGWKIQYVLSYDVPSYEYLYTLEDQYLLKMRLVDHVFNDMVVDEVTTHIILPENSHIIRTILPYSIDRQFNSTQFSYLDTTGRPTVSFKKRNVVEHHMQEFILMYQFSSIFLCCGPLLLIAGIYIFFLITILFNRWSAYI